MEIPGLLAVVKTPFAALHIKEEFVRKSRQRGDVLAQQRRRGEILAVFENGSVGSGRVGVAVPQDGVGEQRAMREMHGRIFSVSNEPVDVDSGLLIGPDIRGLGPAASASTRLRGAGRRSRLLREARSRHR